SSGVSGASDTGDGGEFQTTAANGLTAANNNSSNPFSATAISASILGDSKDLLNDTRAILATNQHGDAGDFSGSYIGVVGRAPQSGYPMDLVTPGGFDLVLVDGSGNMTVHG